MGMNNIRVLFRRLNATDYYTFQAICPFIDSPHISAYILVTGQVFGCTKQELFGKWPKKV